MHFLHRELRDATSRRRPSAAHSWKPPIATSRSASSNSKPSSTASATRPPRPSRCRAASRNWRRSSASRFRRKRRRSTSRFRSPSRAGASWPSSSDVSKSYGDKARLRGCELHHRARRPRRAGRRQRRRQIHADQAPGRRRAAHRGRIHAGAQRASPTTSRRTSTRSSTPNAACSTI